MSKIVTLKFPVNNWSHLYSLQQAIIHNSPLTGRTLGVHGRILNQPFLQNKDTDITIEFIQVNDIPSYPAITSEQFELGIIKHNEFSLSARIQVDRRVFEELRKNLMEYADIEGIHIMITLGLLSNDEHWQKDASLQLVQLDYAMKGDA